MGPKMHKPTKGKKAHKSKAHKSKAHKSKSRSRTSRSQDVMPVETMLLFAAPAPVESSDSNEVYNAGGKSKLLLLLIELMYPLGWFGLDRLYMGCPRSALLKLLLFVIGVVLFNYKYYNAGVTLLLIWLFFGLFDFMLVIINAVTQSKANPFCTSATPVAGPTGIWSSPSEIKYGAWFAMAIVLIYLFTTALAQTKYDIFGRVRSTLAPDDN